MKQRLGEVPAAYEVRVGPNHACAILEDRGLACWQHGEERATRLPARNVSRIALSAHGTCALLGDHSVRCWKSGSTEPSAVPHLPEAAELAGGGWGTCALVERELRRWKGERMIEGAPPDLRFQDLHRPAIGARHACALMAKFTPVCWGDTGEVGGSPGGESDVPQAVPGFDGRHTTDAKVEVRICAVDLRHRVHCFEATEKNFSTPRVIALDR